MYLYKIENLANNKVYVGITSNMKRRWKEHKNALKANRHGNIHLQAAWNLYGEHNFKMTLISSFDNKEDLNKAEIDYINKNDLRNSDIGYNIAEGGNIFVHSQDAKNSIGLHNHVSVICKNLKTGEEKIYKRILDVAADGFDPKIISNPCTDRNLTYKGCVWMYLEDYNKNPEKLIEKHNSRQNVKARPQNYTPVFGMCIRTGKVLQYKTTKDCYRDGVSPTAIRKCCSNPNINKSYKGFVWATNPDLLIDKLNTVLKNKTHKVKGIYGN